jgi:hypothetical protein
MLQEEDEDAGIGVEIYDDGDDDNTNDDDDDGIYADEGSSPLELPAQEDKEENFVAIATAQRLAKEPNAEIYAEERITMIGDNDDYDIEDGDGALYTMVKSHSVQINKLTTIMESLQSKVKQLEEAKSSIDKTISAKRRNSSSSMKAKKNSKGKKKSGKNCNTKVLFCI